MLTFLLLNTDLDTIHYALSTVSKENQRKRVQYLNSLHTLLYTTFVVVGSW